MARLTVTSNAQPVPKLAQGTLMVHNEEPPMVVIVDEVVGFGEGFFGTDLETGVRIEYDTEQFKPFIGKITLEQ
jgi:hypothetical protein